MANMKPCSPGYGNEKPARTPQPTDAKPTPREWRPGDPIGSGAVEHKPLSE
jgi:hypothetical protein